MIGAELAFAYTLIDPNGTAYDVTDRADIGSLSGLSEETEEDLLQHTHSDMAVVLADDDGFLRRLLRGVARGQVWEFIVERETGRRRPKWERIFAGVLDVPASIQFDNAAAEVHLQVFAYSKLLELYNADALARTFASPNTGSVTAGSASVTLTDSTGMLAGDKITLAPSGASGESHRIKTVNSKTSITTVDTWTGAFSNAPLTVETPFPRSQTIRQLATQLFALGGITDIQVDIAQQLASTPFTSPLNAQGLPAAAATSMLEKGGALTVYQNGHRYSAIDSSSPFSDAGADTAKQDWKPYLAAEPGTLQPFSSTVVYDYVDAAHPNYGWARVVNGGSQEVWLTRNGANWVKVDSCSAGIGASSVTARVECTSWGEVWLSWSGSWSYQRKDPETQTIGTYSGVASGTSRVQTGTGTILGSFGFVCGMRFCQKTARMIVNVTADASRDPDLWYYWDHSGDGIYAYDHGARVLTLGAQAGVLMPSFRAFDSYYAAIVQGTGSSVALWSQSNGALLAVYEVSSTSAGDATACTFKGSLAKEEYEGIAGGVWFSLSTRTSGVVPYADFAGLSAAGALRELAVVTGTHVWVDNDRTGLVLARNGAALMNRDPVEIPEAPLDSTERPVWEWQRRGVWVLGKDEDGNDITGKAGDDGDSASRLEVDVQVPVNQGLANALANAYYAYLGADPAPRQLDERIVEPTERPLRLLDLAVRDGITYLVLRVDTDFDAREQTVQLVEKVF